MVDYMEVRGSACDVCCDVYHRAVMDFHHVDPSAKVKVVTVSLWTSGPAGMRTRVEADKCALLCSNCHRMEHVALRKGYTTLPEGYTTPDGSTVVIPDKE